MNRYHLKKCYEALEATTFEKITFNMYINRNFYPLSPVVFYSIKADRTPPHKTGFVAFKWTIRKFLNTFAVYIEGIRPSTQSFFYTFFRVNAPLNYGYYKITAFYCLARMQTNHLSGFT
jgi:hypothetical protein